VRARLLGALLGAAGTLALGLAAGCGDGGGGAGTAAQTSAPEQGGVVVVGHDQAPETLNGMLLAGNTLVTRQSISPVVGEHMLTLTPDFRYVPVLAESVPNEADGTLTRNPFTVTFRIRKNAAWSDGTPVTSADMVFTWKTIMDPDNAVAGRTGWDLIDRIETPDARTFTVVFTRPYAPWKDLFSPSGGATSQLLPKHVLEGKDFDTVWTRGRGMIGTGPFLIDSYSPRRRLVLVRNPRYWNRAASRGGPHIDRIVHVYLKDSTTQEVQFETGEVNMINPLDFGVRRRLAELPHVRVEHPPGVAWEQLSFNLSDPLMRDVNVRRAICYAIDRSELIRLSTRGETFPLDSFLVPQQQPYYTPAWKRYEPDPAKVEQALAASGYTRNADGVFEKDGRELTVELSTIAGNETRKQNLRLIAAQLERVGIRARIRIAADFFDTSGPLLTGRYQIGEFAFSATADPSSTGIFRSDQVPAQKNGFAGQNTYFLRDPELDRLLDASDAQLDEGRRAELMRRIQERLADRAVLLPLYQFPEILAYPDNLHEVLVNPTQVSHYDQVQNWFFSGGRASR
jgi:peptide/nickel transport system substrate-binding protein